MTTLVAIPFYGCDAYIDEAVRSVLAQSVRDLVCLVAGDGVSPPVTVRDERLRIIAFPTNEGAPATLQAMLLGSPFGWFAAHGADDWAEPGYLEGLLALGTPANASAALYQFDEASEWVQRDRAHVEFGVFDADLLRSVGGYGVELRCGMDTLLYEDILPHVQPIAWTSEPRYHKRMRSDSLTHHPDTTFGTPYRNAVFAHNADVRWQCTRIGFRDVPAIRRYRESLVPVPLRPIMAERVEMVREALA